MNAEMSQQAQIRRLQDAISIVGVGVAVFSAWTLTKIIMFATVHNEEFQYQSLGLDSDIPLAFFYVMACSFAVVDLAMRLYVCLSARAEGRGKKKGSVYLVVAGLIAIANAVSIVTNFFNLFLAFTDPLEAITSFLIDVTSFTTIVFMISCVIRLRRITAAVDRRAA